VYGCKRFTLRISHSGGCLPIRSEATFLCCDLSIREIVSRNHHDNGAALPHRRIQRATQSTVFLNQDGKMNAAYRVNYFKF
jgi:hypothetical protein